MRVEMIVPVAGAAGVGYIGHADVVAGGGEVSANAILQAREQILSKIGGPQPVRLLVTREELDALKKMVRSYLLREVRGPITSDLVAKYLDIDEILIVEHRA